MSRGLPNWDEYPVSVELRFATKAQKDDFMSGLSDGFGENSCQLDWPWRNAPKDANGATIGFEDQPRFAVSLPYNEDEFDSWEEAQSAEDDSY